MKSTVDMRYAMAMVAQERDGSAIEMEDEMEEDYDTHDDMIMEEDDAANEKESVVPRASKAVINFKPKGKKLEPKVKPQMAFTAQEAELNPRLNQDRKKLLKQQQRKVRRAQAIIEEGEDLDMDDDDESGLQCFGQGSWFDLHFSSQFEGSDDCFDARRFKGTTLILPSVSIGNVPQLATDLLLATLKLDRVGCIEDENVIPVVGPADRPHESSSKSRHSAPSSSSSGSSSVLSGVKGVGLSLAVEVFQSKDGKWTLIQQRSPTVRHRSHYFVDNLVQFIKDSEFDQVVLLTSADGARRIDIQLRSGTSVRYIPSQALPKTLLDTVKGLGFEQLERVSETEDERRSALIRRQEHFLTHDHASIPESSSATTISTTSTGLAEQVEGIQLETGQTLEKVPKIPNGGIARRLHSLCQEHGIPILTIVKFAMEGDNAPDAIFLANVLNAILKVYVPTEQQAVEGEGWKVPKSWDSLYGNTFQQDMY
ncbi:Proteasome assembly chaperone 2 [Modicella reniformis]|uniref:Proteasome assembly chaperone 2 n=1 Tax=Modicella reniformis TaxID=1440133 RepID=A0A9P6LWH6_9FUNG|nr:Proteasome assembly chaperone 2 [Modicella reniformis]